MNEDGDEALEPTFVAARSFQSPQSPTLSSTVSDAGGSADPNSQSTSSSALPPFRTLRGIITASDGLDYRLPDAFSQEHYARLDFHTYEEEDQPTRLLDGSDTLHPLIPQLQSRPCESEPTDPATITMLDDYTAKMYEYLGLQIPSKLPSFDSQFSFPVDTNSTGVEGDTTSPTTLALTNSPSLPNYPAINRSHPPVPVPTPPVQFLCDRTGRLFMRVAISKAKYQQLVSRSIMQANFVNPSQPSHTATNVNEPVSFETQLPPPPQQQPPPQNALVPVSTPPVQFLCDRTEQLFSLPILSKAKYQQLGSPSIMQGNFVTPSQPSHTTTLVTNVNEPVSCVTQLPPPPEQQPPPQHQPPPQKQPLPQQQPPPQQQPQPIYHISNHTMLEHETAIKAEESSAVPLLHSAPETRKRKGRKLQAETPLEAAIDSDVVGSSSVESSGQVAAIFSTANVDKRSLMQQQGTGAMGGNVSASEGPSGSGENRANSAGEKQTKKKRKSCGECVGCRRKDNCNNCAPCRNVNSRQICRMRKCVKLYGCMRR